ncbi:MAG: peptide chain release factor N(5)-glutamine methyltransferase [Pseudomonadota bacterium]
MSLTINRTILLGQTQLATQLKMNSDEAKFETQLLLQHALKVNRAWLVAHALDAIPDNLYQAFEMLLKRHLKGEPVAYILGYREFFGLTLKVSADTLIPRPDTETLVESALDKIPSHTSNLVLDLGTGSGAIALAIAKNRPNVLVTAVDASQAALNVAIENALHLNIKNVHFELSDWFSILNNQLFDVIVSNPPYIEASDTHLKQGDLRFEPLSALSSGVDGFDDLRIIIHNAPNYLKQNGWLMLEHGYNQAEYVAELLAKNGFTQISHVKDLSGILRVTIGCYVDD